MQHNNEEKTFQTRAVLGLAKPTSEASPAPLRSLGFNSTPETLSSAVVILPK